MTSFVYKDIRSIFTRDIYID